MAVLCLVTSYKQTSSRVDKEAFHRRQNHCSNRFLEYNYIISWIKISLKDLLAINFIRESVSTRVSNIIYVTVFFVNLFVSYLS